MAGRQILCRRLKYTTEDCKLESVPLCHDLLRLSSCCEDLFVYHTQLINLPSANTGAWGREERGPREAFLHKANLGAWGSLRDGIVPALSFWLLTTKRINALAPPTAASLSFLSIYLHNNTPILKLLKH